MEEHDYLIEDAVMQEYCWKLERQIRLWQGLSICASIVTICIGILYYFK